MLGVWKRGTPQKELSQPEDTPTLRSDGPGKRTRPATVESSAACNRAHRREDTKKEVSWQGKLAIPDREGWSGPRRTSFLPEIEDTSVREVSSPYRLLETKALERTESCLPTPGLSEKWKPAVHHSKQKSENKGKTPPALKAAVKGPSLISTLTVTSTRDDRCGRGHG